MHGRRQVVIIQPAYQCKSAKGQTARASATLSLKTTFATALGVGRGLVRDRNEQTQRASSNPNANTLRAGLGQWVEAAGGIHARLLPATTHRHSAVAPLPEALMYRSKDFLPCFYSSAV